MIITVLKAKKYTVKEAEVSETLKKRNLHISNGNGGEELMVNLYRIRNKRRYSYLSLMKNPLRIFMLYRVLKLPGFNMISMILHDVCGAVSYALGVAKIFALLQSAGLSVKKRRKNMSHSSNHL
jgi:hypothetical protein